MVHSKVLILIKRALCLVTLLEWDKLDVQVVRLPRNVTTDHHSCTDADKTNMLSQVKRDDLLEKDSAK